MKDVNDFIEFVKSQAGFHERQSKRFSENTERCALHKATAEKFKDLATYLDKVKSRSAPLPQKASDISPAQLSLSWNEIEDLPEELMAELSISESDKTNFAIIGVIDDSGGIASLDQILVALYRRTGQISKRIDLNSRLYRMIQKGLIFSVPGKKGVYSTQPIAEDNAEASTLYGQKLGRRELRCVVVNNHLIELMESIYGFSLETPRRGEPYYRKEI